MRYLAVLIVLPIVDGIHLYISQISVSPKQVDSLSKNCNFTLQKPRVIDMFVLKECGCFGKINIWLM